MHRRKVFLRAAAVIVLVWLGVWGVRVFAGSRKITAERVNREIVAADFADWSDRAAPEDSAEGRRRLEKLEEIANMVNLLDFNEREKNRQNRSAEGFFRKLSGQEKARFIDLTIAESMNRFMESLDAMPPSQRRKFVEQGLKEIEEGRTAEEMARTKEMGADLLGRISEEGMRAYFDKSSADTKLDLAPLMEAVNETMQGLRGNEFGPARHQ